MYNEIIGMFATILLIVSMSFSSKSLKSRFIMRIVNMLAAMLFIIYGCLVTAYSTVCCNSIIVVLDFIYLIIMFKNNVCKHDNINNNEKRC